MSVSTKSAPIDGKENVFDYQISVGKETGNLFKPGFIIDTKVIVRRHLDNTYNLQVSIDINYVKSLQLFLTLDNGC